MSIADQHQMSLAEYLEFEQNSDEKHEYVDGELIPMNGASFRHNQIVTNLVQSLCQTLDGDDYQVLASNMRVGLPSMGNYVYPDLTVIRGEPVFEEGVFDTLLNPIVLVEVLSDSTEAYDRGRKFANYREIDSLEDYVLVSQSEFRMEVFSRKDAGEWTLTEAQGRDHSILIPSLEIRLTLADVYNRVEF